VRTIDTLLTDSPVFAGLEPDQLEFIAGCARNVGFDRDERVFREGEPADVFYLVRRGRVALSAHVPGRGDVTIDTIEPGEVLGWSWLFPPFRWHFDARAVEDVRAVVFDGECLRGKCADDHALGHELLLRFGKVMIDRLRATRVRLLDVYGNPPPN
jgi:CRP-like cAMP-binding protein